MLKKSLSTMLAMVLTITMTFITPMEVSATSDDNLIEEMNTSGLEVQFVDSLEDLDSDLEKDSGRGTSFWQCTGSRRDTGY